jgi:transposase InsO family protein
MGAVSKTPAEVSNHDGFPVYANLLARDFTVYAPDSAWVIDSTYIWTDEGWLLLATVSDLFSRKVVGWFMSDSLKSRVAIDALEMAITHRKPPAGLAHHSDLASSTPVVQIRRCLLRPACGRR